MMKINNTSINKKNVGEIVTLYGWVNKKRDLGGLIFIDLRDRSGLIQLVINPESDVYELASTLKSEYVIKVSGKVVLRKEANSNLKTGEIEIEVQSLDILNKSLDLPFDLNNVTALEDTRLKYRYLDLRREELKNNLMIKHRVMQSARSFYALPQSPQLFKQILMMSSMERYYQIARCFRDEDLRADRQPEFTQIDMEMSFLSQDEIMSITEGLLYNIFKDVKGIEIKLPIDRITYEEAINLYGSDKPDLRFGNPIYDITESFKGSDFSLFNNIINDGGIINTLVFKEAFGYSRKDIDRLTEYVKTYGAKALAFLKYNGEFTGSIAKFVDDKIGKDLVNKLNLKDNALVLIIAGDKKMVKTSLGALRCKMAKDLGLINKNEYAFTWVTDFPMFEYSEEEGRYIACHHPFTLPQDINSLSDKEKAKAYAYDIVINGYEAGGGSLRIYNPEEQEKVLNELGFTKEQAKSQFGFLLEALKYGCPPHGGLALGLERLTMILCGTENIRDVIAFPKTTSASCLMTEAPSKVALKQLDELHIKISE